MGASVLGDSAIRVVGGAVVTVVVGTVVGAAVVVVVMGWTPRSVIRNLIATNWKPFLTILILETFSDQLSLYTHIDQ